MQSAKKLFCSVFLGLAVVSLGACSGQGRPFWKFWASGEGPQTGAHSLEIPAPPEVVMPSVPMRILDVPKTTQTAASPGETKRRPAVITEPALRTVYFEFDSARLTEEAKEILRRNAEWLRAHPNVEVQVQGHCDERGTVEYNFNLGQRRADAVKNFLVRLGVPPDRIHTISYGEERPAVPGHNESAWRLNRRVEFHTY